MDDYISDNNAVRVIDEYVKQLDMEGLKFQEAVCPSMGRPPYDPKDMLKLYIYGYLNRFGLSFYFFMVSLVQVCYNIRM